MRRLLLPLILALMIVCAPAHAAELELRSPIDGSVVRGFHVGPSPWSPGHRGVDLRGSPGQQVLAAAQGRVHFAGSVAGRPSVSIDHGNGLRTTYTPVAPTVAEGDVVAAGDPVGTLLPGHCQPACLHWGLTDGEDYFDPLRYLATRMVRLVPMGSQPVPRVTLPAATVGPGPGEAPVDGRVTSRFGMRLHPVTGVYKLHDGVDYGAPCGTPIHAPWAGEVIARDVTAGYGYRVHVRHDGGLVTAYAHLPRFDVAVGERIPAGGRVGVVGTTGYSTGCHLHWMAWQDGQLVDPETLLG